VSDWRKSVRRSEKEEWGGRRRSEGKEWGRGGGARERSKGKEVE